jgi:2-polyprenyl-3-methyl-5-hydroxy-6-metoxy-1,4-benzoquinol methylase
MVESNNLHAITGTASHSPCPICFSVQIQSFLAVDSYRIVRCARCGFLFVSPPPSQEELASFYQQMSYYQGSEYGYANYFAQRPAHERLARERLVRIERLRPYRGRILDVGCAAGFFLHVAKTRGWEPVGVEVSREMARYAEELLNVSVASTTPLLGAAPTSFDAVTMWEYIEHIADPRSEVERLTTLLKPGGILALSTPNANYWVAVHRPSYWREFKPPAHIGFFTEVTLRRMLMECGLEVITVLRTQPHAPSHPYTAQRLLETLRDRVGNGANRRTPIWWSFSLAWRAVEWASRASYKWRWPQNDVSVTLEAYARKPVQ